MKAPFAIHADMESLLQKVDTCHNNPEKSSTTKINKHKAFHYLLPTHKITMIVIEAKKTV